MPTNTFDKAWHGNIFLIVVFPEDVNVSVPWEAYGPYRNHGTYFFSAANEGSLRHNETGGSR